MRKRGHSSPSDFPKRNTGGSDNVMEVMTGKPIEKWSDVGSGTVHAADERVVAASDLSQGERFRQLREITGMNRKDFSEYLGIPYRTMSDWENNLRTMPGYVFALIDYKVRSEFGMKLPQELDPNTLGNVRRGLEDQIEQNDNNLDGCINNVKAEEPTGRVVDNNANGIPDEEEARDEAREKVSILKQLREEKHGSKYEREIKPEVPALGL